MRAIVTAILCGLGGTMYAFTSPTVLTLNSPDGRREVKFEKPGKELTYSIKVDGTEVILP